MADEQPHQESASDSEPASANVVSAASVEPTVKPEGKRPRARYKIWLWRTAQVLAGLLAGLVLTELAFWWRADGAFPHVNVYIPDDALGVRLEPGAEQRFKLLDNPVTDIAINSAGYRGDAFPAVTDGVRDEILVVGDSQVFGLGVEQHETFSAQLAELTGRTVINGGVPTYGPKEYTAVVEEMLAERRPATVVYTVNFVNDLFESDRPNSDRHAVWDGWAVRKETAPTSVTDFPGRKWLFSRSHAFYAFRRWWYNIGDKPDDRGFESEGTWTDIATSGKHATETFERTSTEVAERNQRRTERHQQVSQQLRKSENSIDSLLIEFDDSLEYLDDESGVPFQAARASPGDILEENFAEEARSVAVTADLIRQGVKYREALIRKYASKRRSKRAKQLTAEIGTRAELQSELERLHSRPIERPLVTSALEPRIREVKAVCDAAGVELVVLALPIDVQVSSDQWAKYDVTEPIDMMPTRVLLGDLVSTTERMGARAIDVTDALAAVDGEAFLNHDIHMTPLGHRAVAEALAVKLAEPPPLITPDGFLPENRTRVPPAVAWRTTAEISVRGSSSARCETHLIDEWLKITCMNKSRARAPSGIALKRGGHGEAMIMVTKDAATLVAPLFRGDRLEADFFWTKHMRELVADWPQDSDKPTIAFSKQTPGGKPVAITDAVATLCECHQKLTGEQHCSTDDPTYDEQGAYEYNERECRPMCTYLYGAPSDECMTTYDTCADRLMCARGDPATLPRCGPGYANAGGTGQCFALCNQDNPCETGTCTPWQGSSICR